VSTKPSPGDSLQDYADVWDRKPVLRAVYQDFYDRLAPECRPGTTIEIGGGVGNLKQRLADVVATDIQSAPWLDCVADAERLPFAAGSAANIVMVDVLHHLEFPAVFFREAARVLRPGGRTLMVEPAITWGSTLFYRLFHHERVRTSAEAPRTARPTRAATLTTPIRRFPPFSSPASVRAFMRAFPSFASYASTGSALRPIRSAAGFSPGAC
jgi:SAM-dependent methyltransferase